jgi:hypothetical protein
MFGVRLGDSNRTAYLWAVTVPHTNKSKLEVFDTLSFLCIDLVVAEEVHKDRTKHHHLYLRTNQPFLHSFINQLISEVYDIVDFKKFQVATIQKLANYLKYISKEDTSLLFKGIGIEEQFSFYYSAHKWANSIEEFDVSHPFVLKYPQYYKLCKEVFLQVQRVKGYRLEITLRPYFWCSSGTRNIINWQTEVVLWWNDWVINGYSHKKAQLYLYGESNIGKTTFIFDLLKASINPMEETNEDFYQNYIFNPTPYEQKYAFQTYIPKKHLLMVIDEFNVSEYSLSDLKKCLAGEQFMSNIKQDSPQPICVRKPQIIISNHPPPSSDTSRSPQNSKYKGFNERLKIVHADRRYF